MLLIFVRVIYLGVCAGVIGVFVYDTVHIEGLPEQFVPEFVLNHPLITFYLLLLLSQLVTIVDLLNRRKRVDVVIAVYCGLVVGFVASNVLVQSMVSVAKPGTLAHSMLLMMSLLIFPFLAVSLILQTKDNFRFVIPYVEFARELKGARPLVIDSSSLIDGRIADVVATNIMSAELVIPDFVLAEVQDIADSKDKHRRLRGRRGLEVLQRLRDSSQVEVKVHETRPDDAEPSIDRRIVALAQELGGAVVTNDFNLNRVASVQGIGVINLNDVANALKPRYIPGERLRIKVMKEGESNDQGVGYLDDGTMVVCENARHLIGEQLDVTVTSVLQKSEGRMIFGKPSDD